MKYIIEIEDEPLTRQSALYGETAVYRAKGFNSLVFDEEGLSKLTPMPERLTDDDFETIRIHLSAIKSQLGNQNRWDEAHEYQRIIDRFMAFAVTKGKGERIKGGAEAMTNEKAIELLDDLIGMIDDSNGNDYDEAFRMAIKAIEQLATNLQPSCNQVETDCISRQAAIRGAECIIDHHHITPYRTIESVVEHFVRILNGLPAEQPPVDPERKKGHWIDMGSGQECSECGELQTGYDSYRNYCAVCGADMRGEQDEGD